MRKASTYYLFILTAANAWLTWFFPQFTDMMSHQWQADLEGAPLPGATALFLQVRWWPAAFCVLFLVAGVASLSLKPRRDWPIHFAVVVLMIEAIVLFWGLVAYAIPYVRPLARL